MGGGQELVVSHSWRVMAGRITQSWTSAPHFYLVREVRANRLMAWRELAQKRSIEKVTYSDLLVKAVATALRQHLRLNATWNADRLRLNEQINIGLAVATGMDESGQGAGLVVPVISHADGLGVSEIARRRRELVARAQEGRLRPQDLSGGTLPLATWVCTAWMPLTRSSTLRRSPSWRWAVSPNGSSRWMVSHRYSPCCCSRSRAIIVRWMARAGRNSWRRWQRC